MPIPSPRAERVREVTDGIYYLLVDEQDRPGRPVEVRYVRTVYKVTDRAGLEEAASFGVGFDPATDDVVLHHARIWRNGVAQDRLAGANVQLMRREKELDKGVVDGRKTAHLELKDVRVGDIVDYAYSVESADPLMAGAYQGEASMGWSTPVALTRYRLLWPHGRPIAFKAFAGAPSPRITRVGDRDEYLWQAVDPAPVQKEDSAPDWLDQWSRVVTSSMTSWGQVVAWSLPFYPPDASLPPAWAAKADAIAARFPDRRDRITEALRLVQDEIRYVSLSMGAGSYRPRSPTIVVQTGYGDCKDKALLLVTLLRRLGVSAAPVLTDTVNGRALPDAVPGVNDFDHAIVRIELDGKAYWVDPTLSQQGGRFPALDGIAFGWALPIRPGQQRLEAIPAPQAPAATVDVTERYELPRGAAQDLTLQVTSTYRNDDADSLRKDLASKSLAEVEKKYLKFYGEMYPGLRRLRPLDVSDHRDANILVVREAYVLPAAGLAHDGLARAFPIKASALNGYKTPPDGERRLPIWVTFPLNERHRMVLVTPGHRPPAPTAVDLKGGTFRLARTSQRSGDTLTIVETLNGVREIVPSSEVEAFRSDLRKLEDTTYATLDLTSTRGGLIGGRDRLIVISILLAILLPLLVGSIFGVRSALAADTAYSAEGQFYPVTLAKFVLTTLATAGLYPLFWRWKCWRWAKRCDGQDIQPFWRTVFSVFWLWPLFEQSNRRLAGRALPQWLGIAAAVIYFIWSIGQSALNRWHEAPLWLHIASYGIFVCNLPAVIAVQRLNGPDSTVTRANSRFTWHTAVAVTAGILIWVLVAIGLSS